MNFFVNKGVVGDALIELVKVLDEVNIFLLLIPCLGVHEYD